VNGNYQLIVEYGRNKNYKIAISDGENYLVKQVRELAPEKIYSLRNEATCYWLVNFDRNYKSIRSFVPHYFDYDTANHLLILGLINNARNLYEFYLDNLIFDPDIAVTKGKILASLHQIKSSAFKKDNKSTELFKRQIPWIFNIGEESFNNFKVKNESDREVIYLVSNNEPFLKKIKLLKKTWEFSTLIHGDIKWHNFLISGKRPEFQIKLIDWEIADFGDPCWDATIIPDVLGFYRISHGKNANFGESLLGFIYQPVKLFRQTGE
jgi:hypothetical protein